MSEATVRPDSGGIEAVSRSCGGGDESPSDWTERRVAPRSIPLEHRSWLGWRIGRKEMITASRLLDISAAGVAIETDRAPPRDRDVWFHLRPDDPAGRLWGELVEIRPGRRSRYLVRIAFWTPCPLSLFRQAIEGIGLNPPRGDEWSA